MAPKGERRCRHITTADGTIVRMRATGNDEQLREAAERLLELARALDEGRCPALSDVPLPPLAQKLQPKAPATYQCGRPRNHDGPHRWPAQDGSIAEWETPMEEKC